MGPAVPEPASDSRRPSARRSLRRPRRGRPTPACRRTWCLHDCRKFRILGRACVRAAPLRRSPQGTCPGREPAHPSCCRAGAGTSSLAHGHTSIRAFSTVHAYTHSRASAVLTVDIHIDIARGLQPRRYHCVRSLHDHARVQAIALEVVPWPRQQQRAWGLIYLSR